MRYLAFRGKTFLSQIDPAGFIDATDDFEWLHNHLKDKYFTSYVVILDTETLHIIFKPHFSDNLSEPKSLTPMEYRE